MGAVCVVCLLIVAAGLRVGVVVTVSAVVVVLDSVLDSHANTNVVLVSRGRFSLAAAVHTAHVLVDTVCLFETHVFTHVMQHGAFALLANVGAVRVGAVPLARRVLALNVVVERRPGAKELAAIPTLIGEDRNAEFHLVFHGEVHLERGQLHAFTLVRAVGHGACPVHEHLDAVLGHALAGRALSGDGLGCDGGHGYNVFGACSVGSVLDAGRILRTGEFAFFQQVVWWVGEWSKKNGEVPVPLVSALTIILGGS